MGVPHIAASFFAFAMLARSGPLEFTPPTPAADLFAMPALPLAVDQRDPKASPPAPPAVLDEVGLPRDAAAVADGF